MAEWTPDREQRWGARFDITAAQKKLANQHMDRLHLNMEYRHKARTDLLYLCRDVLGYRDVSTAVHGEIIDHLQKFRGGTDVVDEHGHVSYKPACDIWQLEGDRNTLILFPRGHLKTTIITIAHSIQWIINYPDVRMALSMAIGDQTRKVMTEIQGHFKYNAKFRELFGDYCPASKKAGDWGSQNEFTIPKRRLVRKEPTLCLVTVGKIIAGSHYDVIKNSDLVDKVNVRTPGGISEVIEHFGAMEYLTERYSVPDDYPDGNKHRVGWTDVEGTIYDFGDLHVTLAGGAGNVFKFVEGPPSYNKTWHCLIRDAEYPKGKPGNGKTIWPKRWPMDELMRVKNLPTTSAQDYSCQMRNRPIPPEGGLCDPKDIVFLSRQVINDLLPMLRLHCTIDLHGLEPAKNDNDYTVLTVGGFDRDGRLYILDVRRGRYTPDQVIWQIFDIHARYPKLFDFKIEKDAHARVLLPFLQREASKRQRFPIMVPIRRDTHVSKQQRIRGLQPWFKAGIIRFVDDLGCKTDLILEIMQFPSQSSGVHDDMLDTLADMMQNQEGGVTADVYPDPPNWTERQFGHPMPADRFIGFEEGTGRQIWSSGIYGDDPRGQRNPTGIM